MTLTRLAPSAPAWLLCAAVLLLCVLGVPASMRPGVVGGALLMVGMALYELAAAVSAPAPRPSASAAESDAPGAPAARRFPLAGPLLWARLASALGLLLLLWSAFVLYRPILATWAQRLGL